MPGVKGEMRRKMDSLSWTDSKIFPVTDQRRLKHGEMYFFNVALFHLNLLKLLTILVRLLLNLDHVL